MFVKILFGVIAFLLVAFFGAKNSNDFSVASTEAMTINGEVVTFKKIEYELDERLKAMKAQYNMTELPENLSSLIRGSIVEQLLQAVLLNQNIKSLGIVVTDKELSSRIKEDFAAGGAFNAEMYLNNFLPYYLDATGSSFEDEFRKQLALSKVGETFNSLFEISDDEAKTIHTAQNTKFRYIVVKVPKSVAKPKVAPTPTETDKPAPENLETLSAELDPSAPLTASTIFDKWSKGQDVSPLLKEHNLSQRVTSNLTLGQLERVFDGDATADEMLAIAKLTSKSPFPERVFEKENGFYLVKLDAKTESPAPDAKALETLKASQQNQMVSALESAWVEAIEATATIKKSPKI